MICPIRLLLPTLILPLALAFAAEPNRWQYYAENAEGNPTNKTIITDGNWQICVSSLDAKTGTITLGRGQWNTGILAGSGTLDLRGTLCTVGGVEYATKKFTPEALSNYSGLEACFIDGVATLSGGLFWNCANLARAELSGSATKIDNAPWDPRGTFAVCPKLVDLQLDFPPFTSVGSYAFGSCGCTNDIAMLCPPEVETIGNFAFYNAKAIQGHLRLEQVRTIGNEAFNGAAGLQELSITSPNLVSIPSSSYGAQGVFYKCSGLTNLTLTAPNLTSIGSGAFQYLKNIQTDWSRVCPPSLTNIGWQAFIQCTGITGCLELPNLKGIETMAFAICSGLQEVHIGGAITNLPAWNGSNRLGLFSRCTALTNLVVDAPNFAAIGNNCFDSCSALTDCSIASSRALVLDGTGNFASSKLRQVTLLTPSWTSENLDKLLSGVAASDGEKSCTLAVDAQGDWAALATKEYLATETPPKPCLGVYRADLRKAWMIPRYFASPTILYIY